VTKAGAESMWRIKEKVRKDTWTAEKSRNDKGGRRPPASSLEKKKRGGTLVDSDQI